MLTLTPAEARQVAIHAQGLGAHEPFGRGKSAALRAILHLGYVQLDTISVVERAHHHVLWSRVPDYSPAMLHELQAQDRQVFEYWSHAAAFLPLADFRFSLPRMHAMRAGRDSHWFRRNRKIMQEVLARIRDEGPLRSSDFENPRGRSGTWFDWKPAKRALDQLWIEGTLLVRERRGFQKVYDLAERVLPAGTDLTMPKPQEHARFLIQGALRAHGLATEAEICYQRRGVRTAVRRELRDLVDEGKATEVRIAHYKEEKFYADPRQVEASLSAKPGAPLVRILSPFDNSVIQRKRVKRFFSFDYQIECYTPEHKRKYGYFCLPVLLGDRLVARVDAKAEREERVLRVHRVAVERRSGFDPRSPIFKAELERFARFNGCERVQK